MSNKFLGVNSIKALKSYIDQQVAAANNNTSIITVQAYSYHKHGEKPSAPNNGDFDIEGVIISYPENWYSLDNLLSKLEDVESALMNGSIWMTVGVKTGDQKAVWSTPIKISGQNGVSVKFKYTYSDNKDLTDEQISKLSDFPNGVSVDNRAEYVWTQYGESKWNGPSLWAVWAQDANMVFWRYCVTSNDENGDPIYPNNPGSGPWVKEIPRQDISEDYPNMWMSYQIVPAGHSQTDEGWSEPILFGHYGKNGSDGKDGNIPDYTKTLYCKGVNDVNFPDIPGIIAPEKPEYISGKNIEDYITTNWLELPNDEEGIWWMCTFTVKGTDNTVIEIGSVKRYNGVDGYAKPGPFVKYLYAWSADQTCPKFDGYDIINDWRPNGWYETPDYDKQNDWTGEKNSEKVEASLWMIAGTASGLNENGYPEISFWSEPLKISGPRGPIAHDYRIELRYSLGVEAKPSLDPQNDAWDQKVPTTTKSEPYVWAQSFLVYYKMKYSDTPDANGNYGVVEDKSVAPKIIERYGAFRLSGLNGEDGNRRNNINYSTNNFDIVVKNFIENNYYISNSEEDVTYNIQLDTISFVTGYTGKFSNIGKGKMIISSKNISMVGSCTSTDTLTILPGESVELICYNNESEQELIVVGKLLETDIIVDEQ